MEDKKIIQKIYSKIEEIPTLSPMLQKIVNLIESSRTDAQDLTDVISRDPSLTSKMLKVANSAYYGFSRKIDSLDRAVVLLGFNMIRSLAMSIGLVHIFPKGKADHFSRERLWIHSLAVATSMKEMGRRSGRTDESDSLFVAGLLHDIGKVVFDQFFPREYDQVLEEAGCLESVTVCETEIKHFGMDHGEAGSILLRRWNFPGRICSLVALDHKKDVPEGVDPAEVSMLHLADILAKEAGMGVSETITPSTIRQDDLDTIGLTSSQLEEVRGFLYGSKEGIYSFFSNMS